MTSFRHLSAALAAALCLGVVQAQPLSLGAVHNKAYQYLDGAGCYYVIQGYRVDYDDQDTWRYAFLSTLSDDAHGWVSLGDRVVVLNQVEDSAITPKVGELRRAVFQAEEVSVTLDVRITNAEPGNWDEAGMLTAVRDGQHVQVAVEGNCGS